MKRTERITFDALTLEQAKGLILCLATAFSENPEIRLGFFSNARERKREQGMALKALTDLFSKKGASFK